MRHTLKVDFFPAESRALVSLDGTLITTLTDLPDQAVQRANTIRLNSNGAGELLFRSITLSVFGVREWRQR